MGDASNMRGTHERLNARFGARYRVRVSSKGLGPQAGRTPRLLHEAVIQARVSRRSSSRSKDSFTAVIGADHVDALEMLAPNSIVTMQPVDGGAYRPRYTLSKFIARGVGGDIVYYRASAAASPESENAG